MSMCPCPSFPTVTAKSVVIFDKDALKHLHPSDVDSTSLLNTMLQYLAKGHATTLFAHSIIDLAECNTCGHA